MSDLFTFEFKTSLIICKTDPAKSMLLHTKQFNLALYQDELSRLSARTHQCKTDE